MFLGNPFPEAFGLDISDLSIKLVQLRQHRPLRKPVFFSIQNIRSAHLAPGCIVNGEIQQPEIVRKKIIHLLGKDHNALYPAIKSPWVVASLPEPKTFLKLIDITTPAAELSYDEVSFYASKHLPFELEETYLDWQLIDPEDHRGKMSQVLIGGVPKVIADSYTYLLEAAGLSPLALEIESVAIARAMITGTKDYAGVGRAILDLGAARSSIIVYDKNSIQFSTTLAFSGELVTAALAQGLNINYEMAEKIKIQNGVTYDAANPHYGTIVDDLVDQLVAEIKRVLLFYKEHFSETNPIDHITICGGFANFKNLDTILSAKLHISAQPGNAWKNISLASVTEEKRIQGLRLPCALGLALRAAENPLRSTTSL